VNICTALIPDTQAPETFKPCDCAFNNPSVTSQVLAGLDPSASDAWSDPTAEQGSSAFGVIIRFVRMQFSRTFAGMAPFTANRRNGINERFKQLTIVDVAGR
jgi:hypothetical protein